MKRWHYLLLCIVFLSLGSVLLLPIYGNKSGLDIVQDFLESNGSEDVAGVGDPPSNESAAYHYWYAPPNSFGVHKIKTVNWTYFKQLFLAHTDWMLEARIGTGEWFNADEYLTIERTWNESGFWKFNLILDKPAGSPMVDARFTFGIDLSCLQYVEKSGTEVWINYTANATETYNVMFNWSDIAGIPGLVITKGVQGDMFWFRFRRDDIPAGQQHYEFDPTFGGAGDDTDFYLVQGALSEIVHGYYDAPASSGTLDNITIKISTSFVNYGDGFDIHCALYEYVDYSSSYAGDLLATTEVKNVTSSGFWSFEFGEPKPSIVGSTNYYLAVQSNVDYPSCGSCNIEVMKDNTGTGGWYEYRSGAFENPMTSENVYSTEFYIFGSYTEGVANTAPTIAGEIPANTSTGIELTPVCNVTANDADGDSLNVTFWENTTGSYVLQQKNTSVSANSSVQWDNYSNANTGSTKYWWKVHVDDGTDNVSEIYYFTTAANSTWQQNFTGWWTGGNISTWIQNFTGYWTGGNDTVSWTQNFTGWWTGGNIATWIQNFTGYFTGGNTTRLWTQNFTGYFTGGNDTVTWKNNFSGYWTGGHISEWQQNFTGYFTGGNDTVVWQSNFSGWWTGGNIGSWTQNFTGWWTGGNISQVWTQNFTGYWTGGNISIVLSLTNEYPVNGSTIYSVQPTLYFTLSSPLGGMSYNLYIGNTNTTANFLLDSDTGLDNGTFHYVNFYNASSFGTTYWWRVHYNDSSSHVNETFSFTPVQPGGGGMSGAGNVMGVIGLIGIFGLLGFIMHRRRRER